MLLCIVSAGMAQPWDAACLMQKSPPQILHGESKSTIHPGYVHLKDGSGEAFAPRQCFGPRISCSNGGQGCSNTPWFAQVY
jgi:hypothetical protein